MRAILIYKVTERTNNTMEWNAENIRYITNGQPDFRVFVDDKFVFSVSPNNFISFEYNL